MVLDLDGTTAGIPWELLDSDPPGGGDLRPWAIRSKLLRKLRTNEFRAQVVDADPESHVLVIGEPKCDPLVYPRLPGARDEARVVVKCFSDRKTLPPERIIPLISPDDPEEFGPDARTVINALFERNWRIVHIAGHGVLPEKNGEPRGVVLSNGTFLGPKEIRTMPVVPELVFVNCCHLAARNVRAIDLPPLDIEDQSHPAVVVGCSVVEGEIARTHQLTRARLDITSRKVPRHHVLLSEEALLIVRPPDARVNTPFVGLRESGYRARNCATRSIRSLDGLRG